MVSYLTLPVYADKGASDGVRDVIGDFLAKYLGGRSQPLALGEVDGNTAVLVEDSLRWVAGSGSRFRRLGFFVTARRANGFRIWRLQRIGVALQGATRVHRNHRHRYGQEALDDQGSVVTQTREQGAGDRGTKDTRHGAGRAADQGGKGQVVITLGLRSQAKDDAALRRARRAKRMDHAMF